MCIHIMAEINLSKLLYNQVLIGWVIFPFSHVLVLSCLLFPLGDCCLRRLFSKASTWDLFSIRASSVAWSTGSYTIYFSLGILAYLKDKGWKCRNKVMEYARSATTVRRIRTDLTPAAHLFIHIFWFLHIWLFYSEEKLTSCFLNFLFSLYTLV